MKSFADVYAFVAVTSMLIAFVSGVKYGGNPKELIAKKIFKVSGLLFVIMLAVDMTFDIVPRTENNETPSQPSPKVEQPVEKSPEVHLKGRGFDGRSEPQYVGVSGFVAVWTDQDAALMKEQNYTNTPWQVPTYSTDGQSWFANSETINHKEPITVLEQFLKHEGYDNHSGYLKIRRIADGREFFINVRNFVTKPYWDKPTVIEAVKAGCVIVTYHQKSNYPPVGVNNSKVTVPDGLNLLAVGLTGTYPKGKVDRDTHQIEVGITPNMSLFFNAADLTLSY